MFDLHTVIQRENVGFNRELGIRLIEVRDSFACGEIKLEEKHLNPFGNVHGGSIFTLMDTIGGVAASTQGNFVATSSSAITFLNPASKGDTLIARAEKIKNGKSLLIYELTVTTEKEVLIAKATFTYFRLPQKIADAWASGAKAE